MIVHPFITSQHREIPELGEHRDPATLKLFRKRLNGLYSSPYYHSH